MVVNLPTFSVCLLAVNLIIDCGGGATAQAIEEAFKLITSDSTVTAVFVNIFGTCHPTFLTIGGIVRCDSIAQGLINTVSKQATNIPIVARLQGTKMKEAQQLVSSQASR
jgi:succinyl-CoA synthetase beta subunit